MSETRDTTQAAPDWRRLTVKQSGAVCTAIGHLCVSEDSGAKDTARSLVEAFGCHHLRSIPEVAALFDEQVTA